jgi:hypothetical protein
VTIGIALALAANACGENNKAYKEQNIITHNTPSPDKMTQGDVIINNTGFIINNYTRFCGLGFVSLELASKIDPQHPNRVVSDIIGPAGDYTKLIKESALFKNKSKLPDGSPRFIFVKVDKSLYGYSGQMKNGKLFERFCQNNGINIIINETISLNSYGELYSITLTARQGRSFWRQVIERRRGQERPGFGRPLTAGEEGPLLSVEQTQAMAIPLDAADLAKALSDTIFDQEARP